MTRAEDEAIVGDRRPGYREIARRVRAWKENTAIAEQYAHDPVTVAIYVACANGCALMIPHDVARRHGVRRR